MTAASNADRVVIVGAGQAASELAGALRQGRFAGPILIVGEEPQLPYQRPPLSKAFLSGAAQIAHLQLKPADSYARNGIEVRTGTRVDSIDRAHRCVRLADGGHEPYGKLVLALGGRPRPLALPGLEHPSRVANLHYLRTIADAERLRHQLQAGSRLVIVGGGYIGLEVAALARGHGLQVTILEALPRVLARVTAPEISDFYAGVHRSAGVEIRTGAGVDGVQLDRSGEAVTAVICADGSVIPTDVLVIGVGLLPNVELARAAGLEVDNGIVVNELGQTSDPDILAIGDCSNQPSALYGRRVRIESVPNALAQARTAAAWLCGRAEPYGGAPWFWSDQYDLKLQIVGLSQHYDTLVIRGTRADRSFIAFYLRDGQVIAADAVNRPKEFLMARRWVAERCSPAATRSLSDESRPLQSLLSVTTAAHTG